MKSKLFGCLAAAALVAATAATPTVAGGSGVGIMRPGSVVTGRSVVVPGGTRVAGAPVAGRQQHHFRNFVGVPYYVPYYYDYAGYGNGCWQQEWISNDWQWINVCDDSDYSN
jgi:hypothetical protein